MSERVGRIMTRMTDEKACACCLSRGESHEVVFAVALLFGRTMARSDIGHLMFEYLCDRCSDELVALASTALPIIRSGEEEAS